MAVVGSIAAVNDFLESDEYYNLKEIATRPAILSFFNILLLKSLSPINFVKFRLSNFLGNEFLVKMNKLLRNYTFKIVTISKLMYIWSQ